MNVYRSRYMVYGMLHDFEGWFPPLLTGVIIIDFQINKRFSV
jgi:hypothetical protein